MKKYLEIQTDKETRFWRIEREESSYTVQYGKLGNKGRTLKKDFDSVEAAEKAYDKQVAAKLQQGYEEADSTSQDEAIAAKEAAAKAKANEGKAPQVESSVLRSVSFQKHLGNDDVRQVLYHPEGHLLYSLIQGQIVVWDVESGEIQHRAAPGISSYGAHLQWSQEQDALLCYGGYGSKATVLSPTLEVLGQYHQEHKGSSQSLAGYLSATTVMRAEGTELHVWDRESGALQNTVELPLEAENYSLYGTISPDGSIIACGDREDSQIHLIDIATGDTKTTITATVHAHALVFSPDSTKLATFEQSGGLTVWDVATKEKLHHYQRWEWHNYPQSIEFSRDGHKVLLKLSSKTICWDLRKDEDDNQGVAWQRGGRGAGSCITLSPDGTRYAYALNRRIFFGDANTGAEDEAPLMPNRPYDQLHADDHGQLYAISSYSGDMHTYGAESFEITGHTHANKIVGHPTCPELLVKLLSGLALLDPTTGKLTAISPASADNMALGPHHIAITQRENYESKWLRILSKSGAQVMELEESKKTCPEGPMCFSPNGIWLYGGKGKRLLAWNLETGERVFDVKEQPMSIEQMAISPDGKWLATSDRYRNVIHWDLSTPSTPQIKHSAKAPKQASYLRFSWDGDYLIIGMPQATQTRDTESGEPVASVAHSTSAEAVCVSDDATLYLATSACGIVAMDASALFPPKPANTDVLKPFLDWSAYDADTSLSDLEETLRGADWERFNRLQDTVPLRRLLQKVEAKHGVQQLHYDCTDRLLRRDKRLIHDFGHKSVIIDESTSPDDRWLATGSWTSDIYEDGGEIQIWERETGRCVNILNNISGGVGWPDYGGVSWSPDGSQLGVCYNTNGVGNFLPFSTANYPMTSAYVTNGGNRPPGWEWTDDGKAFIIYYGECCIAPLHSNSVDDGEVNWFPEEGIPAEVLERYSHFVDNGPDYGDTTPEPIDFSPAQHLDFPAGMTLPHLNQSPLVLSGKNLGNRFVLNPAFPIRVDRQWSWCVAFPSGLVVCPKGAQDQLQNHVCFSIENRFAWPVTWADERHYYVTDSMAEAVTHPLQPLSAQDAKSLGKAQPSKEVVYFYTRPITEHPYYEDRDWRNRFAIEEYQVNTQEANVYQSSVVYEGDTLTEENLQSLVGKVILYAEGYSPERIQVGSLMSVKDGSVVVSQQSPSGSNMGIGSQGTDGYVFIGDAVPVAFNMPNQDVAAPLDPEAAERAQFPCGQNLIKLSSEDNERGELNIPLPFEGDDKLVLKWEKIYGFEVDHDFAWKWGPRLKDVKNDCHYLGRFYYNDEELEPDADYWQPEHFHECRFDPDGNDAMGSNQEFDGTHGLNVSLLMRYVPKAGQFKSEAPITEIIGIQFGRKGSYRLHWQNQGGAKWQLTVDDEKEHSSEDVRAHHSEYYKFDLFEKTIAWEHNYTPTDWWNTGGD